MLSTSFRRGTRLADAPGMNTFFSDSRLREAWATGLEHSSRREQLA